MFCPKCGQEQASESVRFCSRCGFSLHPVDVPLTGRVVRMAMYLVLTACAIFGWSSFTAGPAYMQIRAIIAVVAATAFYLIFQHDLVRIFHKLFSENNEQTKPAISATHKSALPPATSVPVPSPGSRRVITAEIVQPPSITEHTTTLLDDKKR